jgi:uncharacterized protein (TIGR03083 family)
MNANVSTFAAAGSAFCALTRDIPESAWGAIGLGEWDVRTLVGHTTMAVGAVSSCLTVAAEREDIPSAAAYYGVIRQFAQTAGADELNTKLSRRAADDLGSDPIAAVERVVRQALSDLEGAEDHVVGVFGGVLGIRLSSFVPTRIFELAVHSLDIARAIEIPLVLPAEVIAEATQLAANIAVESGHGTDVLMSLTGRVPLAPGFSAL